MRISDWSSDVCSSDLSLTNAEDPALRSALGNQIIVDPELADQSNAHRVRPADRPVDGALPAIAGKEYNAAIGGKLLRTPKAVEATPCKSCEEGKAVTLGALARQQEKRSEEHTSELQSLMRISYAVFCLKQQTKKHKHKPDRDPTK